MAEIEATQSGKAPTGNPSAEQEESNSSSEAREVVRQGSEGVADRTEGEADTGREPEYYGEKHDPA